jgi:hypothetical protein
MLEMDKGPQRGGSLGPVPLTLPTVSSPVPRKALTWALTIGLAYGLESLGTANGKVCVRTRVGLGKGTGGSDVWM